MADQPKATRRQHAFQAPKGTRDFFPADLLKRRWIEDAWRRAALCHGFDEIDGPRFEHAELYTVKSGEGILSELFSFTRAGGDTRFALRPEFTPTLARMVAARANSLPKPIKWFSVGPYFRAERPQRGRLREFLQWNVDLIGAADDDEETKAQQDAEVIACCVEMLRSAGLTPKDVRIQISDRQFISKVLSSFEIPEDLREEAFVHLDMWGKMGPDEWREGAEKLGVPDNLLDKFVDFIGLNITAGEPVLINHGPLQSADPSFMLMHEALPLHEALQKYGITEWCNYTPSIVRGLAYYTGMVFEVHETGGKERAIAGGGRYDKLVELFGGPATPACGFAMGDVVLANVLQDKGLMPSDAELRDRLGFRPDVFVISTGDEESESALSSVVATLRQAGLHARHSYKTTRNIGKLLKEAAAVGARFAIILDNAQTGALKNLDTGEQEEGVAVTSLSKRIKECPTSPES